MKHLRAIQNATINGPNGPQYVKGPEVSFDDKVLGEGEVITVEDDFVVNPQVWERVRPTGNLDAQGKPTYVSIEPPKKQKQAAATA